MEYYILVNPQKSDHQIFPKILAWIATHYLRYTINLRTIRYQSLLHFVTQEKKLLCASIFMDKYSNEFH